MSRPTIQELADRIVRARQRVPISAYYRHQSSGTDYRITDHTIRESDNEVILSYCPVGFPEVAFSRPFDEFFELVDLPTGKGPRFLYILAEHVSRG